MMESLTLSLWTSARFFWRLISIENYYYSIHPSLLPVSPLHPVTPVRLSCFILNAVKQIATDNHAVCVAYHLNVSELIKAYRLSIIMPVAEQLFNAFTYAPLLADTIDVSLSLRRLIHEVTLNWHLRRSHCLPLLRFYKITRILLF